MGAKKITERVVVSRAMMGLCGMQVCAVKDATDKEILEVAERDNPCGTTGEWQQVIRKLDPDRNITKEHLPSQCEEYPDRLHFLIFC